METLIVKLDATGDVVRTTPLLHRLPGQVKWLTAAKNTLLLETLADNLQCFAWEQGHLLPDLEYDLVVNLEDTIDVARFVRLLQFKQLFGAYADSQNRLSYTDDARHWFDLSIISRHGKAQADRAKFTNRQTYQELIFDGLGLRFAGEPYLLPAFIETGLYGDVAIAADAGPVWPMKKWAFYNELKSRLEQQGLIVNVLPKRASVLEHLADVRNHLCVVGGDSLPMHFALGTGTACVTLFTCTSPWEIYDYGVQTKILSPLLEEFFYKRGYNERATRAITVEEVFDAVMVRVERRAKLGRQVVV